MALGYMHTLHIGHNVDGEPRHSAEHVRRVVTEALERYGVDGATITTGHGIWQGASEETTIAQILIGSADSIDVKASARRLRRLLLQEEILHTVHTVQVIA